MRSSLALAALALLPSLALAQPLTTAFTYQCELTNGSTPASGTYDFKFFLFDAGGNQLGPQLCSDNVAVANGTAMVQLDFGSQFTGQQTFLEIWVRPDTGLSCANNGGFTVLSPRQALTGTPNAIYSLNAAAATTATNATQLNNQPATFYLNASNLNAGTISAGLLGGTYTNAITLSNTSNIFSGSGSGLTNLNASSLASGTLNPARLPLPLTLTGTDASQIIRAENTSTGGGSAGVYGLASATTGNTYGVHGVSASPQGIGGFFTSPGIALLSSSSADDGFQAYTPGTGKSAVVGIHSASSGPGIGLYGESQGTGGIGVYGNVWQPAGATRGGYFVSASNAGTGVQAYATASSGTTYGGYFHNASPDGAGAVGYNSATTGNAYGLQGQSNSTSGTGVSGVAPASSGFNYGVRGQSYIGVGVYGGAYATTGSTYGVQGQVSSTSGTGVQGWATAATGSTYGVSGQSDSASGTGVSGFASTASGGTFGVTGQSSSTSGTGVKGYASAPTGNTYGVSGQSDSTSGTGLNGVAPATSGGTFGVAGQSFSTSGTGVKGYASALTGSTYGVYGQSDSSTGFAVGGYATGSSGLNYGVYGQSNSTSGNGVFGNATASSGTTYGGFFQNISTSGRGVYGVASASTGATYGGFFQSFSSSGAGVYGFGAAAGGQFETSTGVAVSGNASSGSAGSFGGYFTSASTAGQGAHCVATAGSGTTYGVVGESLSAGGYGVYSLGRFASTGAKAFRIDHPADPENKYLFHYCIESPEVLNAYTGKVTLNEQGEATIDLPPYFASINKDPRYTLTPIGAAMPLLHVAEEVSDDALEQGAKVEPGQPIPAVSFRIAGGAPGAKVSWEVKALRNDRWVQQHGAPVEQDKSEFERGKYQHPDLYGKPAEKGMSYRPALDAAHGPLETTDHDQPSPGR